MQILVVEDEPKLAKMIQQGLEADNYSVQLSFTGEEGFFLVQTQFFDLVILDILLPGRDGLEILGTLRQQGVKTPVLLLTCKDTIEDRVRGLEHGADDYLVKPFAFSELLARIHALLRRGPTAYGRRFALADLELDTARRFAARGGRPLDLTVREFELLAYLFANAGRVVARDVLARDIWKITSQHIPLDNVIDVQIARLRRKIDGNSEQKLLHTVRGVGFVLKTENR